jgi:hypothetical protein
MGLIITAIQIDGPKTPRMYFGCPHDHGWYLPPADPHHPRGAFRVKMLI